MVFSELYKMLVIKATFLGFRGGDGPNRPSLVRPWCKPCFVGHIPGLTPNNMAGISRTFMYTLIWLININQHNYEQS